MNNTKKTLLIFFGEYRLFDLIIPQLLELDKVDIIFSTWDSSVCTGKSYKSNFNQSISESDILNVLPTIKQHHVTTMTDYISIKSSSWKMYWHWKNAINNVENPEQYKNVILHRCDMISEWHKILNMNIEDDVLYCQTTYPTIHTIGSFSGVWVNDYYFFGGFDIMKRFINSFDKKNYYVPHFPIWDVISENNIKFKQIDNVVTWLITTHQWDLIEFIKYLNSNNIKILDEFKNPNSKLNKTFYNLYLDN